MLSQLLLTGCLTPAPAVPEDAKTAAETDTGTVAAAPGEPLLTVWGAARGAHLGRGFAAGDLDGDGAPELALPSTHPLRVDRPPSTAVWLLDLPAQGVRVLDAADPRVHVPGVDDAGTVHLAPLPDADGPGDDGLVVWAGGVSADARRLDGEPGLVPWGASGRIGFADPEPWFIEDVAAVGDPDGDGRDDLGVVVRWWGTVSPNTDGSPEGNQSAAVVLPLGGDGELSFHDAFATTGDPHPLAGIRGAGDLDGDGGDDLLCVGSELSFVSGLPQRGALSDVAGWQLLGLDGATAEPAGDVNGDGHADVVLGRAVGETGDLGAVWVLHGPAPSVEQLAELSLRYDGDAVGLQLGRAISAAGDLDGDLAAEVWAGTDGQGAWLLAESGGALVRRAVVGADLGGAGEHLLGGVDLSGDGVPDLVLSDPDADREGARDAGVVWLWSGADLGG